MKTAKQRLDHWNDVTGAIWKGASHYHELVSLIEDAMKDASHDAAKRAERTENRRCTGLVVDLFLALKKIGGTPTTLDIIRLAGRIRDTRPKDAESAEIKRLKALVRDLKSEVTDLREYKDKYEGLCK